MDLHPCQLQPAPPRLRARRQGMPSTFLHSPQCRMPRRVEEFVVLVARLSKWKCSLILASHTAGTVCWRSRPLQTYPHIGGSPGCCLPLAGSRASRHDSREFDCFIRANISTTTLHGRQAKSSSRSVVSSGLLTQGGCWGWILSIHILHVTSRLHGNTARYSST